MGPLQEPRLVRGDKKHEVEWLGSPNGPPVEPLHRYYERRCDTCSDYRDEPGERDVPDEELEDEFVDEPMTPEVLSPRSGIESDDDEPEPEPRRPVSPLVRPVRPEV